MKLDRAKDMDAIMKAGGQYMRNKMDRIIYRKKKPDRVKQEQNLSVFQRTFTVETSSFTVSYVLGIGSHSL
jgi:predicted secreted protein